MTLNNYDSLFEFLTGHSPFPWQQKLYREFLDNRFRESCPIPTGLGKTSIIAIWLLTLAHHARNGTITDYPRRLVYVVNRRTVVDQSTDEARRMREALGKPGLRETANALQSLQLQVGGPPLAISTLRGQFADNAEWRDNPARPAVIIGTVDMIGSRLLFSGYGRGFKSRPLHAGFLGQDTLLVHDEAHLEPAFQELVTAIEKEQRRCREFGCFRVMELTATSRSDVGCEEPLFTNVDRKHDEVRKRIEAMKGVGFHPVDDERKIADKVFQLAKEHKDSGQAILIFLRKLDDVKKVADFLRKEVSPDNVALLTGTLRGRERDALARDNPVFARFLRNPSANTQPSTVYLVCTSAGEVGVNISADHLVCDLSPFDSMIQRFGRVNRFGDGDAQIDIVHSKFDMVPESTETKSTASDSNQIKTNSVNPNDAIADVGSQKKSKPLAPYDLACLKTLSLLRRLPKREDLRLDASPASLAEVPAADRQPAFTPLPVILPASDILFDAWALTSVRQKLPGRPPVADWLHGIEGWEPPATYVAWREEVKWINSPVLRKTYPPEDLLEDYPLKPHELLRDQTKRVFDELEKIAARFPNTPAWLIDPDGKVEVFSSLAKLVARDKQKKPLVNLAACTVLLPQEAGGLKSGMLEGEAAFGGDKYDIADEWTDEKNIQRRCRIWDDQEPPNGMRLVRRIDLRTGADADLEEADSSGRHYWHWYIRPRSADDDGSRTARVKQGLSSHLQSAEDFAKGLVARLGLQEPEASAVVLAARWHDLGKDRPIWQRSIGNLEYPQQKLAKSGPGMRPIDITCYRHEFGSLLDVSNHPEFLDLTMEVKDIVLHLIAAHHGRARPHFPVHEAFDLDRPEKAAAGIVCEVPRRFARLQRKYGRWGLAFLESLVRAADIMASQVGNDADSDGTTNTLPQGGGQ